MKVCTKCRREWPATREFWNRRKNKHGEFVLHQQCKECRNAQSRKNHARRAKEGTLKDWREYQATHRDKDRAKYLTEHGDLPFCECGCGERVEFENWSGKPRKYIDKSHQVQHQYLRFVWQCLDMVESRSETWLDAKEVHAALDRLRETKGWTWTEMCAHIGVNTGRLSQLRNQKHVRREAAAKWLRVLNGEATSASVVPHKIKAKQKLARRTDWVQNQFDLEDNLGSI